MEKLYAEFALLNIPFYWVSFEVLELKFPQKGILETEFKKELSIF